MAKIVNHINYADGFNRVYCRKLNEIITLNEEHFQGYCNKCNMLAGSAQGLGVECTWTDTRPDVTNPHAAPDPQIEADSIVINEFKNRKKN